MALSHLHLVLNHIPVIGTVVAIGLLLLAFIRRSDDLRRVSLEIFVIVAFLTLPVYLTGVGAQPIIIDSPGVSAALIEAHHNAALLAFLFMLLTGIAAWLGLWQYRRIARVRTGTMGVVLLLGVVTLASMGRAANLGGDIRHPEISGLEIARLADENPGSGWLTAQGVAELATGRVWVWPAAEALHFIGLWLLFGVVLLVNLRMLGLMKQASFPALHRLLPWGMLGLAINIVTGMIFVIAAPGQYANPAFYWKIGLLLAAGFNLLYLTVFDEPWAVGAGQDAPITAKTLAGSAIVLWIGVMYFGRMLPFLGDAF